jgi:long-chain fatty acid transport protein
MKRIVLMSLVTSSILVAGGYQIPETSTNAVALSAANIAHNKSADAAYYNPANMVFMSNENHIEADLMYIGLDATKFQGTVAGTGPYDINAESESFIVPSLHYVSGQLGDKARVGVSIVSPGGLSKRWNDAPAKTSAEEFTLQIIEVNPTAAFKLSESMGVAVGFRILHTSGVVKSNGVVNITALGGVGTVSRDMTGDSIDFGYNLALAYKPISDLEIGLTYRSKVNLSVEGNAKLNTSLASAPSYDGKANVTVPLPAAFNAAIAYTLPTNTTVEVVYEKTYWSAYDTLDFNYDATEGPVLGAIFGKAIPKNWKDTNTYRLGLTQELDSLTLMAGVVIGESPVPSKTLGFELPDSDSVAVSLGGRYQINKEFDIGLAALYSMHENRTITAADANDNGIVGEFSNSNALLISAGVGYKF